MKIMESTFRYIGTDSRYCGIADTSCGPKLIFYCSSLVTTEYVDVLSDIIHHAVVKVSKYFI